MFTASVTPPRAHPQLFLLAVFNLYSFFNSPLSSSSSIRQGHRHSHTGTVLIAFHSLSRLAYAPDVTQFAAPRVSASQILLGHDRIISHLLVSVIVLASLVGSWFGISCGFGLENVVSVRGSHRDGDKALRHRGGRRLGQDGRANRTWLKVCFSLLTTFKCWLLIYNRESDIIISLWTCTNLPFRFSEKRDFSQRFGHWFLWPDLLLGSFLGLGE